MFAISEDVVDLAARPPSLNAVGTPVVSAEDDSATAGRPGTARQTGDNGLFGPMALQRWQSEARRVASTAICKTGSVAVLAALTLRAAICLLLEVVTA